MNSSTSLDSDIPPPKRCVAYKLGGSLFNLPDLAERLRQLWRERPDSLPLLIVGGGAAADIVRGWDRTFQLGDETAHWLAIEALDFNARLFLRLLPELRLVRNLKQLELAHASGHPALLCVDCFVKWLETQPTRLPHHWDVTSDSIAAAAAVAWNASELVLVKSCDKPESADVQSLSSQGLIDPHFAVAADGLEAISWINLRTMKSGVVRERGTDPSRGSRE